MLPQHRPLSVYLCQDLSARSGGWSGVAGCITRCLRRRRQVLHDEPAAACSSAAPALAQVHTQVILSQSPECLKAVRWTTLRQDPKDRLLPPPMILGEHAVIAKCTHPGPILYDTPSRPGPVLDPRCFLAPGPRERKGQGSTQNLAHSRTELSARLSRWPAYRDCSSDPMTHQVHKARQITGCCSRCRAAYDEL